MHGSRMYGYTVVLFELLLGTRLLVAVEVVHFLSPSECEPHPFQEPQERPELDEWVHAVYVENDVLLGHNME